MRKYFGAYGFFLLLIPFVLLTAVIVVFAGNNTLDAQPLTVVANGNPIQGQQEIINYGCGACHEVAGIAGADGKVGPPLTGIASRSFIAGRLANNTDNLIFWIRFPQSVSPGTDMPDLGISEPAARDIAAYLYTLK
jgi:cytochrome c2